MVHFDNPYLDSFIWKQATYNYKPIEDWYVNEIGILYNVKTKKFKYGRDNVEGVDLHQRVSIRHKLYYVHRIVAESFVKNNNKKRNKVVRHLDDDPRNNYYKNLKWGTHKENTHDAIINNKIKYDENRNYTRGDKHGMATLTNNEVENIIDMLNNSITLTDISKKLNVDRQIIAHIYNGRSWRCLTEKYLPFPKQGSYHPLNNDIKNIIINYLHKHPDAKPLDVVNACNIEYNQKTKNFIVRQRMLMKTDKFND